MRVKRIVANFATPEVEKARVFYEEILGLKILMDLGWIRTYGLDSKMPVQISVMSEGGSGTFVPDVSIEVDDIDEALVRFQNADIPIEYGPKTEPWGVRRFYVRDPFGKLINILQHEWSGSMEDRPPAVGVAHVVLHTDRMAETARFMRTIGMRALFDGSDVSVYEMRGGTHLIMMQGERSSGEASFDLMVDDLQATHKRFVALGLSPSAIEARPQIDHAVFTVQEPAGNVITFFSSHASGKPV